jgi:hypothetical protein
MKLNTTKKYVVDGITYDSKADASKAMALKTIKETIPLGVDEVINNAKEIIKALNLLKK